MSVSFYSPTEYPLGMVAAMALATIEKRKTQTRRLANPVWAAGVNPDFSGWHVERFGPREWRLVCNGIGAVITSPVAETDRFWVREPWRAPASLDGQSGSQIVQASLDAGYTRPWCPIQYEADKQRRGWSAEFDLNKAGRLRPGMHMPRPFARMLLEVTRVRVQRLQDITEADAVAEGAKGEGFEVQQGEGWGDGWGCSHGQDLSHRPNGELFETARDSFADLWNGIYGTPRPVKSGGVVSHYVSHPWACGRETLPGAYKGLPHLVIGNPWVLVYDFRRVRP